MLLLPLIFILFALIVGGKKNNGLAQGFLLPKYTRATAVITTCPVWRCLPNAVQLNLRNSLVLMGSRGFGSKPSNNTTASHFSHTNSPESSRPKTSNDANASSLTESELAALGRKVIHPKMGVKGIGLLEKFLMMYTCKICNGRNSQMVIELIDCFTFIYCFLISCSFHVIRFLKLLIFKAW
jgi:hypothetical protein